MQAQKLQITIENGSNCDMRVLKSHSRQQSITHPAISSQICISWSINIWSIFKEKFGLLDKNSPAWLAIILETLCRHNIINQSDNVQIVWSQFSDHQLYSLYGELERLRF